MPFNQFRIREVAQSLDPTPFTQAHEPTYDFVGSTLWNFAFDQELHQSGRVKKSLVKSLRDVMNAEACPFHCNCRRLSDSPQQYQTRQREVLYLLVSRGCKLAEALSPAPTIKLPTTRAVLPRISSSTSGFFFWGMILLPVHITSGSDRKPNSWVLHKIQSSAQPLRCSAIIVRTNTDSRTKSQSLETSKLFAATPRKPSSCAA